MRITPPGSKSLTIRALAAAALADGVSQIESPLIAEDTRAAVNVFRSFGAKISQGEEVWSVAGRNGVPVPPQKVLDVNESGLTARIALAVAGLVSGRTSVQGRGRLPNRPMGPIVEVITRCGAVMVSEPGAFPITLQGSGTLAGGELRVDVGTTTQALTAMLLVAPYAESQMTLTATGEGGALGYVELTRQVLTRFGVETRRNGLSIEVTPTPMQATTFPIEPDASSAAYPMLAAAITGSEVVIPGLGIDSRQPDMDVATHLAGMGCAVAADKDTVRVTGPSGRLQPIRADLSACPDGALALAVAALRADGSSLLTGLQSLEHKESSRLVALAAELRRVGAEVETGPGSIEISPGRLRPAQVDSHGDHRIAMSFGVLSLLRPDVTIDRPGVVAKTWPGYWQMLSDLREHLV